MSKIRRNWVPLITVSCLILCLVFIVYAFGQVSPQIQGAGAPSNPCNNGGQYYLDTTNHVTWLCPSSGSNWVNTQTTTSGVTPGLSVQGTSAGGSATSGNPVLIAGSDGTNARTIFTSQDGAIALGNTTAVYGGGISATAVFAEGRNDGAGQTRALGVHSMLFNGSTILDPMMYCATTAPAVINPSTATTTLLVAAASAKTTRLCSIEISSAGTQTAKVIVGTQTTNPCDTGAVTISPTYQLVANTNLFIGGNVMPYVQGTAANQQVCVVTSAAVSVFVAGHYVQY